jgi:hypothetical protein
MVGQKKVTKSIFALCIAIICYYKSSLITGPYTYTITSDSSLSDIVITACTNTIQKELRSSLPELAHSIKHISPTIEQVCLYKDAHKKLHVAVHGATPRICFNEHTVLLSSGNLVHKDNLNAHAYQEIPTVHCIDHANTHILSHTFKRWLLGLDPAILATYAITYHHDYEIMLEHKITHHHMVCSVDTKISEQLSKLCEQIIEQKTHEGTCALSYTTDVRFENQIIVCSQKRGGHG